VNINSFQKICLGFLIFLFVFWGWLFLTGSKEGFYNYLYSFLFGLLPLFGGFLAMIHSRIWGGLKSAIGKAVFFIGLGLFCWGCGETIWSYYNFFMHEPAPYPSSADVGFAPSIFFYGLGAAFLARATGAKYGLRNIYAKVFVALAPIAILALSYYVLVVVARGGVLLTDGETPLKAVLDLAYPFGDFLGLTLAIIISGLSFKYLGGRYLDDIISILAGLGVMFMADTVFSYTTTINTYYNADMGDLMLTIGLFLLTFGVLGFCQLPKTADVKSVS
jgi:hypothetical protein